MYLFHTVTNTAERTFLFGNSIKCNKDVSESVCSDKTVLSVAVMEKAKCKAEIHSLLIVCG